MIGLPSISGLECIDALQKVGYSFIRQIGLSLAEFNELLKM